MYMLPFRLMPSTVPRYVMQSPSIWMCLFTVFVFSLFFVCYVVYLFNMYSLCFNMFTLLDMCVFTLLDLLHASGCA